MNKTEILRIAKEGTPKEQLALLKEPDIAKVKDKSGNSVLFDLAEGGSEKVQLALLSHPDVTKVKDFQGGTPLHWLASSGTEKVQFAMLSHPEIATVKDKEYGLTPLHMLAAHGDDKLRFEMLKNPEIATVKDKGGSAPVNQMIANTRSEPLQLAILKLPNLDADIFLDLIDVGTNKAVMAIVDRAKDNKDIPLLDKIVEEFSEDSEVHKKALRKINKLETGHEEMPQGDPELEDIERAIKKVSESAVRETKSIAAPNPEKKALFDRANKGDISLLKESPENLKKKDSEGFSVLSHLANKLKSKNDFTQLAKFLETYRDSAPLYVMARTSYPKEWLALLVNHPKATLINKDYSGHSVLEYLAAAGVVEVLLNKEGSQESVLKHLDIVGNIKDIKKIIPELSTSTLCILDKECKSPQLEEAKFLENEILNRPDVATKDESGESPLMYLASWGTDNTKKRILDMSEDIPVLDALYEHSEGELRQKALKKINRLELGHETMPQGDPELEDIERALKKVSESAISSKIWYHGTAETLSPGKLKNTGKQWVAFDGKSMGEPFWLTPEVKFAKLHGKYIYKCETDIPSEKIFGDRDYLSDKGQYLYERVINEGKLLYDALENRELFPNVENFERLFQDMIAENYDVIETKEFISWAEKNGFQAAYVQGDGVRNLVVFDPSHITVLERENSEADDPVLAEIESSVKKISFDRFIARAALLGMINGKIKEKKAITGISPQGEDIDDIPSGVDRDVQGISRHVINFFRSWDYWGKEKSKKYLLNPEVAEFLKKYQPAQPLKLYRGLKYENEYREEFEKELGTKEIKEGKVFTYNSSQLSSWTTDIAHIEYGEFHCDDVCKKGIIIEAVIPANLLLVQFSLIPEEIALILGIRDEGEVIVLPGKFQATIKSLHEYTAQGTASFKATANYVPRETYLHYSDIPEIKINPMARWRDPIGIYLFPKWFEDKIAPMWRMKKYVFEVTVKDPLTILDLDTLTLEEAQKILNEVYAKGYISDSSYYKNKPLPVLEKEDDFWMMLRDRMDSPADFTKFLMQLGYQGVWDGTGTVHGNERQLILFSRSSVEGFKLTERFKNTLDLFNQLADEVIKGIPEHKPEFVKWSTEKFFYENYKFKVYKVDEKYTLKIGIGTKKYENYVILFEDKTVDSGLMGNTVGNNVKNILHHLDLKKLEKDFEANKKHWENLNKEIEETSAGIVLSDTRGSLENKFRALYKSPEFFRIFKFIFPRYVEGAESFEDGLEMDDALNRFLYGFTDQAGEVGGKIMIYRMLSLKKKEDIKEVLKNKKGLGIYWSWTEDGADAYWGDKEGYWYMLVGKVSPNSINLPVTLAHNLVADEETEIQLYPGAPVEVIEVHELGLDASNIKVTKVSKKLTASIETQDDATAAKPPKSLTAKKYYHGTSDEKRAIKIWAEGVLPDLSSSPETHVSRPVGGRVYMATNVKDSLPYALGGQLAGSTTPEKMIASSRYGFLFVIDGKSLGDIQPDEDQVGKAFYDSAFPWLEDYKDVLSAESPIYEDRADAVFDDTLLDQVNLGEYDAWIKAGKIILPLLSDKEKIAIIKKYGNIAHEGRVMPLEMWRIDKKKSKELKPDGSNFFEVAELVKKRAYKKSKEPVAAALAEITPYRQLDQKKGIPVFQFDKEISTDTQSTYKPQELDNTMGGDFKYRSGFMYTWLPSRIKYFRELFGEPDWVYVIASPASTVHAVYFQQGKDMIQVWKHGKITSDFQWQHFEKQAMGAGYNLKEFERGELRLRDRMAYWL